MAGDRSIIFVSLSVNGTIVAIGAQQAGSIDGIGTDQVKVYRIDSGGSSWEQVGQSIKATRRKIGSGIPCENIHSRISLVGDLVFSHQGEIYGFKFPKRFFGDLFQRSHSLFSLSILII